MEQSTQDITTNYLVLLAVNWRKLVAGTAVCALVGVACALIAPREYESSATLLVYPPVFKTVQSSVVTSNTNGGGLDAATGLAEMMPTAFHVETYRIIAESKELARQIIDKLDLEDMPIEKLADNLEIILFEFDRTAAQNVQRYSETMIFQATADSPELAAQIAQTWVELFKEKIDRLANMGTVDTYKLVDSVWTSTKAELEAAEDAVEIFNKEWNLDLLIAEKKAKEDLITALESELDRLDVEIGATAGELEAISAELAKEGMERIEILFKAPSDDVYWLKERGTVTPEDGLRTEEYNPNFTPVRQKEVEVKSLLDSKRAQKEYLVEKIASLREEIAGLQRDLAEQKTVRDRLERDLTTYQTSYDLVASSREKGKIAERIAGKGKTGTDLTSDIVIASSAVVPDKASGIGRLVMVAAAMMIGGLLSIAYVVADYSLKTVEIGKA